MARGIGRARARRSAAGPRGAAPALAGSPIPAVLAVLAILAVIAGCAGCAARKPAPIKAVFLIVVDTLRPDRLSC
jgi:hypothetical protein